jgi:hypothetical protein
VLPGVGPLLAHRIIGCPRIYKDEQALSLSPTSNGAEDLGTKPWLTLRAQSARPTLAIYVEIEHQPGQ